MQAQQSNDHHNRLPTIDDFVEALQGIRAALEQTGVAPTLTSLRPALRKFADERRERYLAGATNSFDLEQRARNWERAQFSGLFGNH